MNIENLHNNLSCPTCLSERMISKGYRPSGKRNFKCKDCGAQTVSPLGVHEIDHTHDQSTVSSNAKDLTRYDRFFITGAQNATPVPANILKSIERYCDKTKSKLVVVPYRYKNPTSNFTDKDHDWWDNSIAKYIVDRRANICENLVLLGDVKVQPTAARPLTGLDGFTGTSSGIVAHPKADLKTIPTRQGDLAKIMQTTGAITIENYTPSKAGAKGKFHHNFGGLIVEVDRKNGLFHMRRVSINRDGTFYDLEKQYGPDFDKKHKGVEGLILGDVHQWWIDPIVDKAIPGLIKHLNPKRVVMHDVVDSYSVSHHHAKMPFTNYAKHHAGMTNIRREIMDFCEWSKSLTSKFKKTEFTLVPSNHHEHIRRWVEEANWKTDPENAEFYLETAHHMIKNTVMTAGGAETPDPFKFWINKMSPKLNLISTDNSYMIGPFECGMHGHIGPNGARGSLKSLSKIGVKVIVGHVHSPGEEDGSLAVGVCASDMEYANGPSSWLNSQAVVYPDGKATLIHIINGKYTK